MGRLRRNSGNKKAMREPSHSAMFHPPNRHRYVPKRELREFRRRMNRLLHSLMYLLVASKLGQCLQQKRTLQPETQRLEGYHPDEESAHRTAGQERAWANGVPVGLWVVAILIFGFGDSFTSALAFSIGASEANPLLANLVRMLGDGLWSLVVVKTMVLAVVFFLSYYFLSRHGWLVPILLCGLGTYLVINNLLSFFGGL